MTYPKEPPIESDPLTPLLREAFRARRAALEGSGIASDEAGSMPEPGGGTRKLEDRLGDWRVLLLGDRYEVRGELGRGGLGRVLRAYDRELDREVALKLLHQRHAQSRVRVERFLEEASLAARLEHPGIVPVHDVARAPDRRPFFTMRLVEGRTLADLLSERGGTVSERARLLAVASQVARAVAYAHSLGVVHRDLKPANVLVGANDEVQVVDWGLSVILAGDEGVERSPESLAEPFVERERAGGGARTPSLAGSVSGTPGYLAPEQARGDLEDIDARTDVFALGGLLLEVLTGGPPFAEGDKRERLRAAAAAELGPAFERLASARVDAELDAIVRKCLAPEPEDRFEDAGTVAERLQAHALAVEDRARAAELAAEASSARAEEASRRAVAERRARHMALGLAVAIVLLGALGTWVKSEADARRERARDAVEVALRTAEDARGQARVAGNAAPLDWQRARSTAERALEHAGDPDVPVELRTRASALVVEVALEQERVEQRMAWDRDEELLATELVETYLRWWSPLREVSGETLEAELESAFERRGLDLASLGVDGLRARLESSGRRVALTGGLAEWGVARWLRTGAEDARVVQLLAVIEGASEEAALRELAERVRADDKDGLAELALSEGVRALSPGALHALTLAIWATAADAGREQLLRRATEEHAGDFVLRAAYGAHLYRTQRADEALRHLTAAHALRPGSDEARILLAAALIGAGRSDEAERHVRALLDSGLEAPPLYVCQGQLHAGRGDWPAARDAWSRAVELDPDYAQGHTALSLALSNLGDHGAAIKAARRATALGPSQPQTYERLGQELLLEGQHEEARAALQRAVELGATNPVVFSNLGAAWSKVGELEEAARCYRRAIELDPEHATAHGNLGLSEWRLGRPESAAVALREAVRLEPENLWQRGRLGAVLVELDDLEGAAVEFEAARRLAPDDYEAAFNLGYVLVLQGRDLRALPHVEAAVELNPDHPMLTQVLVELLATSGDAEVLDRARAVELAEGLVERRPEGAAGWESLGIALFEHGDSAGSFEAFAQAAAAEGELDAHSLAYFAMAAWDVGEPDQARELLDAARAGAAEGDQRTGVLLERASQRLGQPPR